MASASNMKIVFNLKDKFNKLFKSVRKFLTVFLHLFHHYRSHKALSFCIKCFLKDDHISARSSYILYSPVKDDGRSIKAKS